MWDLRLDADSWISHDRRPALAGKAGGRVIAMRRLRPERPFR
jgi:hypothetical protein